MPRRFAVCVALLLVATTFSMYAQDKPADFQFDPKTLTGNWEGALNVGAVKLRLALKVLNAPGDKYVATMDSVDQGVKDIKIDEVTLAERKVRVTDKKMMLTYEGELSKDGLEIVGSWKQGPSSLPLTLRRVAKLAELRRPQEPKRPFPYAEEEVTFKNDKADVTLAGTFTKPKEGGPFPAAILISGSGPQDRDESLMGHKPFLLLSDYLTRRGIAVLRYDDRGTAKSTGKFGEATSLDFADDVRAAVAYLKTRSDVRKDKIGLIGHSEGGLIAPMVAAESKDVAFIVLLAGPGLSGEEILYLQGRAILKAMGVPEEGLARQKEMQQRIFSMIRETKDKAAAEAKLKEIIDAEAAKVSAAELAAAGGAEAMLQQSKQVLGPWFRFFLAHDPVPTLKKVQCPVLAITGEKDLQVPPKDNNPVIEAALKAAGHKDFTVKELPGLNHLFQNCKTGTVVEYGEIEETLCPKMLDLVASWVAARTGK